MQIYFWNRCVYHQLKLWMCDRHATLKHDCQRQWDSRDQRYRTQLIWNLMELILVFYKAGMKSPVFNVPRELGSTQYGKAQAEAALPHGALTTVPSFQEQPTVPPGNVQSESSFWCLPAPKCSLSLEVVQIFFDIFIDYAITVVPFPPLHSTPSCPPPPSLIPPL